MVDWDGDEDLDLIVGFRDEASFFQPAQDGVYWLENQGLRFTSGSSVAAVTGI